jgi:hypothetical protein
MQVNAAISGASPPRPRRRSGAMQPADAGDLQATGIAAAGARLRRPASESAEIDEAA